MHQTAMTEVDASATPDCAETTMQESAPESSAGFTHRTTDWDVDLPLLWDGDQA